MLNISNGLLPWSKTLTVDSWKKSKHDKTLLDTGSGVTLIGKTLVDGLKMSNDRFELGIQIRYVGYLLIFCKV